MRGKRAAERVALGSACWAAVPLAERCKGGRKLGWRTRHGEGVSGLCGSEPSGVSWAERAGRERARLVGAGPRGRGLRTGLGQQERGSGFGFGFSPHGLGYFGFWVS